MNSTCICWYKSLQVAHLQRAKRQFLPRNSDLYLLSSMASVLYLTSKFFFNWASLQETNGSFDDSPWLEVEARGSADATMPLSRDSVSFSVRISGFNLESLAESSTEVSSLSKQSSYRGNYHDYFKFFIICVISYLRCNTPRNCTF